MEPLSIAYIVSSVVVGLVVGALAASLVEGRRRARLERDLAVAVRDRDHATEALARLAQDREALASSFRALSDETLRDREETLVRSNDRNLKLLLDPLRRDFERLQHLVQEARADGKTGLGTLSQQVASDLKLVREIAGRVDVDARGLSAALRGNINVRGQWGEAVLEQLLNHSGLVKDVHYSTQVAATDEEGRYRPDVIVHTPAGAEVVLDSKVNLASYLDYVQAKSPEDGEKALASLRDQVKAEMADLATRRYQERVPRSVDFVLLFMPVEGAYQAIVASAPDLLSDAMERKVVIAGPSMTIAVLSLVMGLWTRDEQEKNTRRILECAKALAERVVAFAKDLEDVGDHLGRAEKAYGTALKRLREGGRGSVVTSFRQLESLQGKTGKPVPSLLAEGDVPSADGGRRPG